MTTYADDFTFIAGVYSQHWGGRGKGEPSILFIFGEVGRLKATGHCSPEIQCDTVHLGHPSVPTPPSSANQWQGDLIEQMILGVMLDSGYLLPLRPSCPQIIVSRPQQALWALNVMKALAGLNRGFTTKTLVATYKAIVGPILPSGLPKCPQHHSHLVYPSVLNATPIWFTQVSSPHQGKI